jgi:hypothetical protein
MTEIEAKALALLNEVQDERLRRPLTHITRDASACEALCRALEQHEAFKQEAADRETKLIDAMQSGIARAEAQREATEQKLHDFKQEVSDAITALLDRFLGDGLSQGVINGHLHRFIIRKPDPLVEVIKAMRDEPTPYVNSEVYANRIHKKLDALGFEIREKGQ